MEVAMSGAIPTIAANALLNATLGTVTWTGGSAPVPPMFMHLTSNAPTAGSAGTSITGSGYTVASILFNAASGGATTGPTSAQGAISWTNNSGLTWTITGAEIWDSAGSPVRWWYGLWNAGVPISVPASATFQVNVGGVSAGLG